MAQDILICAFSIPSDGILNKVGMTGWNAERVFPLGKFEQRPIVIDVPKTGEGGKPPEDWGGKPFRRTADKMKAVGNGSIISGLLKTYAAGVEPRRIALVGFSAGNSFTAAVLDNAKDAELVDTVISLDGMTYPVVNKAPYDPGFAGWTKFAKRATGLDRMATGISNPYLGPMMVVAHTHIVSAAPASASSTWDASKHLFWQMNNAYWAALKNLPKAVVDDQARRQNEIKARLSSSFAAANGVSVSCGNPKNTKVYSNINPALGYLGNLWDLDFGGTQGSDHCFICYVAQSFIFDAFVLPRWNSRSEAVAGLGGPLSGPLGITEVPGAGVNWITPEPAKPGGGIVQAGAVNTGISSVTVAGGAALAAIGGYYLGKKLLA